jgi:hypothetical protein
MKIKLVHILTETSHEREIESMKSLAPLGEMGIEYIPQINERYVGDAYKHHLPVYHGNHGPGHYGSFQSFKKAVLENFTEDVDAFVLCECDCVLKVDQSVFVDLVKEANKLCKENLINYVSFGSAYIGETLQSPVFDDSRQYGSFYLTDKIIMTHCIMFPRHSREYLINHLDRMTWDALDIWLNFIFRTATNPPPKRFLILREPVAIQYEGISLLDNVWKGMQ